MQKEILYQLENMQVIRNLDNYLKKENDITEKEYFDKLWQFFINFDFMKLGQSVNQGQWQTAIMVLRRLQTNSKNLEIICFDRLFLNIRDAIFHQNKNSAIQIMAKITAKRVEVRKKFTSASENCEKVIL